MDILKMSKTLYMAKFLYKKTGVPFFKLFNKYLFKEFSPNYSIWTRLKQ